jgi:hypothetical protein
MRISPQEARRELVLLRHEVRSLRVNPRRLSLCPLPAGEGVSEFQRQGWVRAKSITPHPSGFCCAFGAALSRKGRGRKCERRVF